DDEVTLDVDGLARANHGFPPSRLAGHRMAARHVLVSGERMAHQHGVRARRVQPAIRLVGNLEGAERNPAIERQRPVSPEANDFGVARVVSLAQSAGCLTFAGQVGFNHICSKCPRAALRTSRAGDRGPLGRWYHSVNVFFDFGSAPTYQCRMAKLSQTPSLADLRKEIDRLDEAMHQLLM